MSSCFGGPLLPPPSINPPAPTATTAGHPSRLVAMPTETLAPVLPDSKAAGPATHFGSSVPLRILNKGPDYFRRQVLLHCLVGSALCVCMCACMRVCVYHVKVRLLLMRSTSQSRKKKNCTCARNSSQVTKARFYGPQTYNTKPTGHTNKRHVDIVFNQLESPKYLRIKLHYGNYNLFLGYVLC